MTQKRFHVLGLPHLPVTPEITACAYTQKLVKLCRMLKASGHHVTVYGGEGSNVSCDEFVQVIDQETWQKHYGKFDRLTEYSRFGTDAATNAVFNANAIREINQRKQPTDFLLSEWGVCQQPVFDGTGLVRGVESGIGYEGVFARFKVFESYAWMHHVYGLRNLRDGAWYDAVIPNFFDPDAFPFVAQSAGEYALFVGRLTARKGLDIAVQVTKRLGVKLLVAGPGSLAALNIADRHVFHVGCVGAEKRAELMGNASMVFAPSYYLEPFGGVAVEAQMCGTPVITTDWGAYPETVVHGVTGYRCRTFEHFLWAARHAAELDRSAIASWAVTNYSLDRIRKMYDEYWDLVAGFPCEGNLLGWYSSNDERQELDWLRKEYPK